MPGGLPDRRRGRQVERSAGIGAGCFGHFLNADAAQAGQFGSVAGDEGRLLRGAQAGGMSGASVSSTMLSSGRLAASRRMRWLPE